MKIIIFLLLVWTLASFLWNYPVKGFYDQLMSDEELDEEAKQRVKDFSMYLPNAKFPFVLTIIAIIVNYLF